MPRKPLSPEAKAKNAANLRKWREENPDKVAEQRARNNVKNYARVVGDPERAEKQRQWGREHAKRVRLRLIALLGGKCIECGHDDVRSLHVDHVKGNGAEERRARGRNYYLHIIDNVASGDYVLRCACHNDIKTRVMGEYVGVSVPRPREMAPLTDPQKLTVRAANIRQRERRAASPEMQEKHKESNRQCHARLRQRVIDALGGVCTKCGWDDPRALHVDHVHGGGGKHRKSMSGTALYKHFIANAHTGEYELLCSNHNQQKKIDLAETALGHKRLSKRKHVYATEPPPPKKPRATSWTPERLARQEAERTARALADAELAMALAAKREAAKNSTDPT